jgi:hypothetical protein
MRVRHPRAWWSCGGLWLGLAACGPPPAVTHGGEQAGGRAEAVAELTVPPKAPWQKGQLHLHSNSSGDSDTPPADVARWYAEHGYDFIVFTDHDRITQVPGPDGLLVMAGIELTQNLERCDPPPEPGLQCLLHVNGLFVGTDTSALAAVQMPAGFERIERYGHAIAVAEALGGVAMLNHPNFHYAADANLVAALAGRGLTLLEVANEAVDSNNEGDDAHPSTEALWDAVLSTGARVWGVATDDAHHYYDAAAVRERGELAHVGDRGWVMVRAEREPAAIRAAIERGDFYGSSGVELEDVVWDGKVLRVTVSEASEGALRFAFIGDGGKELHRARGREGVFTVPEGYAGYVRAVVTDRRGRKAWVQPVWPGVPAPGE